jgi:nicotinamidase-related amidase
MASTYAVVTNDLQVASTTVDPSLQAGIDAFIPKQLEFLHRTRSYGIPVIHTQLLVSDTDDHPWNNPDWPDFVHGESGSRMIEGAVEPGDIIVQKFKDSAFFGSTLEETLRGLDADTVVITGAQAQICIQTTAAEAYFRGFKVIVPSDCVVSTVSDEAKLALEWLSKYCATVISAEEVYELFARVREDA